MKTKPNSTPRARTRLRVLSALGLPLGLLASPAFAQPATDSTSDVETMEAFTITGSHIPTTETAFDARTLPVQVIGRSKIDQTGYKTAAELLQKMTLSNGGSVPISNNGTGFTPAASSTSLRGLGPEATLVLINGLRVTPYPIGDDGTTAFVDLNAIPIAAVERVEVLKDGASATYGADAVAGVINIILRRDFDGSEVSLSYGNTASKDSSEFSGSFITGASSDKGWVTVGLNYYNREPIFARDRSYSAVPPFLSSNSSPLNFQLTRETVNEALGQAPGDSIAGLPDVDDDGEPITQFFGSTYDVREQNDGTLPASAYTYSEGRSSAYNFNLSAGSYPLYTRTGAFGSFEREAFDSRSLKFYGDFIYQNSRAVNELAPSATGNFANPGGITLVIPARTASPILTPDEQAAGSRTAALGAYNPFNPFNQDIAGASRARLAEFGNRIYREDTNSFLATFGLKTNAIAGTPWAMDVGFRYSRISTTSNDSLVSISRLNRAMDANDPIFDPSSSEYIGTTIPYNPFGYFENEIASNALVVPYASVNLHNYNISDLGMGFLNVSNGELFELPAGNVGVAAGMEIRRESLEQSPDALGVSGDVIGSSTANITNASRDIASLFAEVEVPITAPEQNIPGAYSLSVNLAGRYEEFRTSDRSVFVPKIGVKWLPLDETFVVRASYGEGLREPSLYELFAQGLTFTLTPISDPVSGVAEPEQDVSIASSPTLEAEKTKSYNVGLVWTPKQLSGLTMSVDFWKIERAGTVTVDHQDVLNRAIAGETLLPGESVQRDASDNLILINGVFRNLGNTEIQGVDFATSYVWATENLGRFDFALNASYVDSYKIQQFPGAPFFEYINEGTDILFDNNTGLVSSPGVNDDAYLHWKGQFSVSWRKGPWGASITANYTGGFRDFTGDFDPDDSTNPAAIRDVESTVLYDAQINYTAFKGANSWYGDTELTLGGRNILDEDPPYVSGWDGNSSGYPGYLYNSENAFYYLSLSKKL